ncbi:hypothetical protein LRP52_48185 [Photobacterium sp. ZSDE20]|nr:hypothetical protein [Photobacterium sp. ZSDE20]
MQVNSITLRLRKKIPIRVGQTPRPKQLNKQIGSATEQERLLKAEQMLSVVLKKINK